MSEQRFLHKSQAVSGLAAPNPARIAINWAEETGADIKIQIGLIQMATTRFNFLVPECCPQRHDALVALDDEYQKPFVSSPARRAV
jgi:hypothetical protein